MPVKEIPAPHLGPDKFVKLGRIKSPPHRDFAFHNYLKHDEALPTPPATIDWSPAGQPALSNIYLNDSLGDCVIAGGYHVQATFTGNAGNLFTATDAQITKDYSSIGGYVPGRPSTDQGCDLQTAMNFWQSTGFQDGTKLAGWLSVDPTNETLMKQALDLFENLYLGLSLPDAWVNNEPQASGFTWDVAGSPDDQNGHCVMAYGYTSAGLLFDTWGLLGTMTWAAVKKYLVASAGGEMYVLVSQAMLNKATQKAPNNFDWPSLVADFDSIGGDIPAPAPSPTPTPTPTPTPVPTGDEVVQFDFASKTISVANPGPSGWYLIPTPTPTPLVTVDPIGNAEYKYIAVQAPADWTLAALPVASSPKVAALLGALPWGQIISVFGPLLLQLLQGLLTPKPKPAAKEEAIRKYQALKASPNWQAILAQLEALAPGIVSLIESLIPATP